MKVLTSSQRNTIDNALRIAAGIYEADAFKMHAAGEFKLAEQFERQRRETCALANELEQADEIVMMEKDRTERRAMVI